MYGEYLEMNFRLPIIASTLLILGDPGQGKTTFVQKLAFDWAMAHHVKQSNPPLETISLLFVIPLRNLVGSTYRIMDLILGIFSDANECQLIEQWIQQHSMKVIVVLDGLDEMRKDGCIELRQILAKRISPKP